MLAVMMIVYILIRNKLAPKMIIPPKEPVEEIEAAKKRHTVGFDIVTVIPIVALILVIFGTLYSGVCTATESAAVGAIGAGVIVLIQRRMSKKCIRETLLNSAKTSCMIFFLMFGGLVFAQLPDGSGPPSNCRRLLPPASPNRWVTFIIVMIILPDTWLLHGASEHQCTSCCPLCSRL
jgi:TRAP-type mannitol/chloroaromatic compound transport system permease large subunit